MANNSQYRQIREVPLPKKPTGFSSKTGGSKADEAIVSHITNNYSVTAAQARAIVGKVNDFVKKNPGIGTADKAGAMQQKLTSKLPKKNK
jgi:hypothetical protein